jgi:putative transposase
MAEKFQNKFRVLSARWQQWDYTWDAAYFVTICTKERECLFGEIVNGIMNLSGVGNIANQLWYEIKNHAKNVELGEFIVMPNHVHGIIILDGNDKTNVVVETGHALSLREQTPGQQRFQNPGKNSLSSIVGGYKSAVTKQAHQLKFNFAWQSRFHDHVIRDDKSFKNISAYIANNVRNWTEDKLYR